MKWCGGKTTLVDEIVKWVPNTFGFYHEPFLGGGALYWALQPKCARLSDANQRLVRTYRGVALHVEKVIELLQRMPYDKNFYYETRAKDPDALGDAELAAWMIYLNRAGFNGLYRVNRQDKFNVPFGKYTNPKICDAENLRACSTVLLETRATVACEDFRSVADRAVQGDLIYFDPPYLPLNGTSNFTAYTAAGFDNIDQETLRDVALDLKRKGVHVILSNAAHDVVDKLYSKDFEIREVDCRRNINSKGAKRGAVKEFLIR